MILSEEYQTGVVWQDYQHKQLIDLFMKVKEARKNRKDKNLFRYTMAFLAMYVHHHFKLEEKYMVHYEYPEKERHQKEHDGFVQKLKDFRDENKEYSLDVSEELIMWLEDWILSHILENDKTLGEYILKVEESRKAQL